jgi:aminocarboxymuconate-semialdehyde decarboxylase
MGAERFMTSMIYQGVLDRFPGLKIVVAHGGGYMPHYMRRLDRNVTDKPETAKNISRMPSAYLRDFYYDSCVYDPSTLTALSGASARIEC